MDPAIRVFKHRSAMKAAIASQDNLGALLHRFSEMNRKKRGNENKRKEVLWTPEFNINVERDHMRSWNVMNLGGSPGCKTIFIPTTDLNAVVWRLFTRMKTVRYACMINNISVRQVREWFDKLDRVSIMGLFSAIINPVKIPNTSWYFVLVDSKHIHHGEPKLFARDIGADPMWDNMLDWMFGGGREGIEYIEYRQGHSSADTCVDVDNFSHYKLSYNGDARVVVGAPNGKQVMVKVNRDKSEWATGHIVSRFINAGVPQEFWAISKTNIYPPETEKEIESWDNVIEL
jgi:hypothetical protein